MNADEDDNCTRAQLMDLAAACKLDVPPGEYPPRYCCAASCVVPGMLQGWMGMNPATGSYDNEEEVMAACWRAYWHAYERRWTRRGGERDPERGRNMAKGESSSIHIDSTIAALRAAWMRDPDMRLGQLLLNVLRNEEGHTDKYHAWNAEDDEVRRLLRQWANR